VRWALEEAGAPYEYVMLTKEEGRSEEHAARHPLSRVPVLENGSGALFESAALCLHIADLYPEAELIPATTAHERGEVYQWSFFAMTELEPAMLRAYTARHAAEPDAEKVARADARLAKVARAVAAALDGHDYLVGDRFTIADVVMGGVLDSARQYELMPDSPALHAYLGRLDAREAKQRAYAV
jgi:glutathione S-transferase